jgi:hypothetical protein
MRPILCCVAVLGLATWLVGCGAEFGPVAPTFTFEATLRFAQWDSLSSDSCWFSVANWGTETPSNVRLRFWYATGSGETVRVLDGDGSPVVPAQITRGEPRYPRVGAITWDGGAAPEQPRRPVVWLAGQRPYWSSISPDSMGLVFGNNGGTAYHLTATVENREGIQVLSAVPDRLELDKSAVLRSVPLNASGTQVPPRILKIEWEDYGGIRDSLVSP